MFTLFQPAFIGESTDFTADNLLCVVLSGDSLPEVCNTPQIRHFLESKKEKEASMKIKIDAFSESIWTLHLIVVANKDELANEVAEAARGIDGNITLAWSEGVDASVAIESFGLGVYRFENYLSKKKSRKYEIAFKSSSAIENTIRQVNAVYLARDLVNTPSNDKFPQKMVDIIQGLSWKNTKIRVLGKSELEKEGFGMLLAVSAGSDKDPKVVIFERVTNKQAPKYAFVGKGVTFDSGGIQIKWDDAMLEMKMDMAGAAAVIATMWNLDNFDSLPHGVIGAIGLTENMTGENASKPLDIVRAHNGLTVEIHHTDAEGRLVLGDVVSYVSKEYSPENAITIATLTGACIVALGFNYAGVSGTSKPLVDQLFQNSLSLPEKLWTLPVDKKMLDATKAKIADRKNLTKNMKAGSSMGTAFIAQFVPENVAYAHLDIAGPAYLSSPAGIYPSEATGFGFYTLTALTK